MKVGPYWRPHLTGCRTGVGAKARGLRRKNSETSTCQIRNTNVNHETETCKTSVNILTQSRSNLTIYKITTVRGAVRTIEKQHISTKCVNVLYCTRGCDTVERNTDLGTLTTIYWRWSGRSAKIEIHLCLLPHLFVVTPNGHTNSRCSLKSQWLLCVLEGLRHKFAYTVHLCVCISEQTAITALYSINWLVCITETGCVYCVVRAASLHIIQVSFKSNSGIHYKH
jgi:hypothetical protein